MNNYQNNHFSYTWISDNDVSYKIWKWLWSLKIDHFRTPVLITNVWKYFQGKIENFKRYHEFQFFCMCLGWDTNCIFMLDIYLNDIIEKKDENPNLFVTNWRFEIKMWGEWWWKMREKKKLIGKTLEYRSSKFKIENLYFTF